MPCRSTRPPRSPPRMPPNWLRSPPGWCPATPTPGLPTRPTTPWPPRSRRWRGPRPPTCLPRAWPRSTPRSCPCCGQAIGSSPRGRSTARPGRFSSTGSAASAWTLSSSTSRIWTEWKRPWSARPRVCCTWKRCPTRRSSSPTSRPWRPWPIGTARCSSSTTRSPRRSSAVPWSSAQISWRNR